MAILLFSTNSRFTLLLIIITETNNIGGLILYLKKIISEEHPIAIQQHRG